MPHRDASRPASRSTSDLALADDRALVLADLIALRQVRIEVVLAVEARYFRLICAFRPRPVRTACAHAFLVDHRQHAGHGRVDQGDVAVRLAAEAVEAPENSFALEVTWAWTSMPMTTSQSPVAPRMSFFGFGGGWTGAFMAGRSQAGGASHRASKFHRPGGSTLRVSADGRRESPIMRTAQSITATIRPRFIEPGRRSGVVPPAETTHRSVQWPWIATTILA